MEKFQNKYRIGSSRLKNWDYGKNASYFVTICIRNRESLFGEIVEDRMILNELGKIVEEIWLKIPEKFDFAKLENYVIMPNHLHGIITIEKNKEQIENDEDLRKYFLNFEMGGFAKHKNPMLNINLSRIMKWFKGRVTFEIHKIHLDFQWQDGFWDNIIKDEKMYFKIKNYILNNPKNWKDDQFYF